jgi:hypothetical protein
MHRPFLEVGLHSASRTRRTSQLFISRSSTAAPARQSEDRSPGRVSRIRPFRKPGGVRRKLNEARFRNEPPVDRTLRQLRHRSGGNSLRAVRANACRSAGIRLVDEGREHVGTGSPEAAVSAVTIVRAQDRTCENCDARFAGRRGVVTRLDSNRSERWKLWCPGAESNHRHCDFQSHALPTELPGRARAVIGCGRRGYSECVAACPA